MVLFEEKNRQWLLEYFFFLLFEYEQLINKHNIC